MVTLGSKVRINDGATVMPFTVVGDNITLLTQCTTIKGMELKERKYHFCFCDEVQSNLTHRPSWYVSVSTQLGFIWEMLRLDLKRTMGMLLKTKSEMNLQHSEICIPF